MKNPALTADLARPLYVRRPELFNGWGRVRKAAQRARERGLIKLSCRQAERLRLRSIRHDVPRAHS
jgi:hypothetical protein